MSTEQVKRILAEQILTLNQAAARFPAQRGSGRTSPATVWRWVCLGSPLPDGTRLHLEAAKVGDRWLTSVEALERFIAAQTQAAHAVPEVLSA